MKDQLTFSPHGPGQDQRHAAMRVVGFPSIQRPAAGKSKAKGTAAHVTQLCDSAFLADRGCFGRAISPKHTAPVRHPA
jgi:hypothetical protein